MFAVSLRHVGTNSCKGRHCEITGGPRGVSFGLAKRAATAQSKNLDRIPGHKRLIFKRSSGNPRHNFVTTGQFEISTRMFSPF
jgi:hypothetical protein